MCIRDRSTTVESITSTITLGKPARTMDTCTNASSPSSSSICSELLLWPITIIIKTEKIISAISTFRFVNKDEGNPLPGLPKDCLPEPRGVIDTPDRIPVLLLQLVIRLFTGFHLLVFF